MYDTSSAIDHVLSITGQERLSLIGHSMGTTISLVLLSTKPEYNAKVSMMLSFAPIAIFTHLVPGPLSNIAVRYGRQLQVRISTLCRGDLDLLVELFFFWMFFPRVSNLKAVL